MSINSPDSLSSDDDSSSSITPVNPPQETGFEEEDDSSTDESKTAIIMGNPAVNPYESTKIDFAPEDKPAENNFTSVEPEVTTPVDKTRIFTKSQVLAALKNADYLEEQEKISKSLLPGSIILSLPPLNLKTPQREAHIIQQYLIDQKNTLIPQIIDFVQDELYGETPDASKKTALEQPFIPKKLGDGGQANVYLVSIPHTESLCQIVIKQSKYTSEKPSFLKRFLREVKIMSVLGKYPSIPQSYFLGQSDISDSKKPFIAMEYVPGKSLDLILKKTIEKDLEFIIKKPIINFAQILNLEAFKQYKTKLIEEFSDLNKNKEETLSVQNKKKIVRTLEELQYYYSLDLIIGTTKALSTAHENGIIHRDIKPENIITNEKHGVFLMDWGFSGFIKKNISPSHLQSFECHEDFGYKGVEEDLSSEKIFGTSMYLSPERLLKKNHSISSDLWALSTCLYELLVGENPFIVKKVIPRKIQEKIAEVRKSLNSNSHPLLKNKNVLRAFFVKSFSEKEIDRFKTAKELIFGLETIRALRNKIEFEEFLSSSTIPETINFNTSTSDIKKTANFTQKYYNYLREFSLKIDSFDVLLEKAAELVYVFQK